MTGKKGNSPESIVREIKRLGTYRQKKVGGYDKSYEWEKSPASVKRINRAGSP